MQLGIIGLGRMGGNIARRLMLKGHETVVYDRWVMLPAGAPTEDTIAELGKLLQPGDVIIDGGNTYYKDDIRRGSVATA